MFSGAEAWPHQGAKAARTVPSNREMFELLDADLFLANQLFRYGVPHMAAFAGTTTGSVRRERIRREILAAGLDEAPVLGGSRDRPPETLSGAFTRLYGEPLIG